MRITADTLANFSLEKIGRSYYVFIQNGDMYYILGPTTKAKATKRLEYERGQFVNWWCLILGHEWHLIPLTDAQKLEMAAGKSFPIEEQCSRCKIIKKVTGSV